MSDTREVVAVDFATDEEDDPTPLYERERAPVDRVEDLVLLVLAAADADDLAHETLVPRVVALVEDHGDAFEVETETAGVEAFDALGLLASLGYVEGYPTAPEVETAALTDRGERGAKALVAGLDAEAQAALTEVTCS